MLSHAKANEDTLRVQLKWWHQFQFAGYYAAQLKGYYQQQQLNVQLIAGDKKFSPTEEVLNGNADFGISGTDLLSLFTSGKPIVTLGAVFQHSPYVVIADEKKGIRVPSDLIGKKIMASGSQGWIELQALFLREGIPLDSLRIIKHTWNNKDIIDGYADAMTGYQSVEIQQLINLGIKPTYIHPVNYGIDFYGDILFCLQSTVKRKPEETNKFITATFKGWDYAMEHPEEIAAYILTLPGVKERGVTLEDLLKEAHAMRDLIVPDLVEIGHMNEGRWEHILQIHKDLGLIEKNKTIKGFVYNASESTLSKTLQNLLYASIIGCIIFLLITLYGFTLRRAVKKRTEELNIEIRNRTLAQEQLQLSEERLELATQAAGLGVWDWDIVANEVYFNDQWKIMLGYAPHELKNEFATFAKLLHPEEKDNLLVQLYEHIDGKNKNYQAAIRMRKKDNSWKWILTLSKAIHKDENGKATRLTGVHFDIDEIKMKETELQELTNELISSNKELQQFAYITSHNLRAPVANLISLIKLFKKEELSSKNAAFFEKIDFSIHKLNSTLEDLNQILSSRINRDGKIELLHFDTILKETKASINETIIQKKASITSDFSKAPILFCMKKILDSVFINMLTNALKYNKPNTIPIIHFETNYYGEFVVLTISDNGLGIDMEKYGNKIFGLYQRFHEEVEGKGIGLYIIKNQIETLGGRITVDSKLGEGTTFKIFLKNKPDLYDAQKN